MAFRISRALLCLQLATMGLFAGHVAAQNLHLHDGIRTFASLTNTTVTLSGRAELRITGTNDPIPGCLIHLDSPDAWLVLTRVLPSQVVSSFLSRVRIHGAGAVHDENCRVVQFAQGAVVIPQGPDFAPLEVFDGRYFTGPSRRLLPFEQYDMGSL